MNSIKEKVLESIKAGKASMRPRWYFVLWGALGLLGIVIASAGLLYIGSFIFFVLEQSGLWFVPAFGLHGIFLLLWSLPWILVLIGAVFAGVLELLVRHYSFAYRKPLLYSVAGLVACAFFASFIISRTAFHEGFSRQARENRLPFAGGLYRGYQKNPNVHRGSIKEITDSGFTMENRAGETIYVVVTSETRFPAGEDFQADDKVIVLGERQGDTIQAYGIREIENAMHPQFVRHGWFMPRRW